MCGNANPPIVHSISTAWATIPPGAVSVLTSTFGMAALLLKISTRRRFSDWKRRGERKYVARKGPQIARALSADLKNVSARNWVGELESNVAVLSGVFSGKDSSDIV